MNFFGQHLVLFGEAKPPQVHILSDRELEHFQQLRAIRRKHHNEAGAAMACADMFGEGAEFACPTWGPQGTEAMAMLAIGYEGPHKDEVQRICACIVAGVPFATDEKPSGKPSGGTPARLQPEQPRKPPGGQSVQPVPDPQSNAGRAKSKPAKRAALQVAR